MQDINLISGYSDIHGSAVFDIGCGKGNFSSFFIDKGAKVFALDTKNNVHGDVASREGFSFTEGSIDTYDILQKFDIVFSRNVFPFCKSDLPTLIEKIKSSLHTGGVFFFTYFGDKEEWGKKGMVKTLTRSEIDAIVEDVTRDFAVKYFAEELFEGKAMDGSVKNWHMYRVILKKL